MSELFDLEQIYDEQIAPLMTRIIAICQEHDLPMLASFHFARDEKTSALATSATPVESERWPVNFTLALRVIKAGSKPLAYTIRRNQEPESGEEAA